MTVNIPATSAPCLDQPAPSFVFSLIHPSRGRPEKAKQAYDFWMSRATSPESIEHILSIDFDDPKNEEYEMTGSDNGADKSGDTGKYKPLGPNSKTIIDHNSCVVEATNQAAQHANGQILIYMSDDFECPDRWDEKIIHALQSSFVLPETTPFVLKVDDGHQPFENLILTIPIMSRHVYNWLGYFWNRVYQSNWVDCDLYAKCREYIINAPDLLFPHKQGPIDDTYTRSNATFESGRKVFNERARKYGWESPFKKVIR